MLVAYCSLWQRALDTARAHAKWNFEIFGACNFGQQADNVPQHQLAQWDRALAVPSAFRGVA